LNTLNLGWCSSVRDSPALEHVPNLTINGCTFLHDNRIDVAAIVATFNQRLAHNQG
jgi:hypothetical protein